MTNEKAIMYLRAIQAVCSEDDGEYKALSLAIKALEPPVAHPPSACCQGEVCFCGAPATAKVGETVFFDDWSLDPKYGPLNSGRHPLTAYVCTAHFWQIMGRGNPQIILDAKPDDETH